MFESGLLGSGVRAGIYADAIPSFTEDLPAFGSNALLLCTLLLEGDCPLAWIMHKFSTVAPKSFALTAFSKPWYENLYALRARKRFLNQSSRTKNLK